jgi:hypothetical protein
MLKSGWMTLSIIGVLLSAAGFADDATSSAADDNALPLVTQSLAALPAELDTLSRWQLTQPVESIAFSSHWSGPIQNFEFQDSDALARVSKLRSLSLLTFAEFGQARLFLGVNDRGLVGIHFHAFPRHSDERYLEVARLPYLTKTKPGDEAE